MSDDTPTPVFSPDEWSFFQGRGASPEFLQGRSAEHPRISFRVSGPYGTELMLVGDPFGLRKYASAPEQVERTVQIMALLNANLPDGHPAKITREWVTDARWAARAAEGDANALLSTLDASHPNVALARARAARLAAQGDALSSYLPPEVP